MKGATPVFVPGKKDLMLENLKELAWKYKCRRSPSVPRFAIPRPKYQDSGTNGLTACVTDFLKIRGHHANRVNTQGQYNQKLGKFIHGGSTRGAADLNAIINGRSVQIEIKHGRDKLSDVQRQQKASVEAAGGVYLVVKTFTDFIKQYCQLTGLCELEAFRLPVKGEFQSIN